MKKRFKVEMVLEAEMALPLAAGKGEESGKLQSEIDFLNEFAGDVKAIEAYYKYIFALEHFSDERKRGELQDSFDCHEDSREEIYSGVAAQCDPAVQDYITSLFEEETQDYQKVMALEKKLYSIDSHFGRLNIISATFSMMDGDQ